MAIGNMVLDRNPENYFAEVEQSAFSPSSIVPGIELSGDKLLLGRGFSYSDTQRYRLGINYLQLPINKPHALVNNNQRDGAMQYAPYDGGTVNYEPNSLPGGVYETTGIGSPNVYHIEGNIIRKKISLTNDYVQAGERYRSFNKKDQDHLIDNIVDSLGRAEKQIQSRMLDHFNRADPEFGHRVENGLDILSC
jgi:catalase